MKTGLWSRRTTRWLAAIGILFVAAACSGAVLERSSTPTPASTPTPPSSSAPTEGMRPGVLPIDAGPHAGRVLGGGSYPGYTVVVPAGWYEDRGYFTLKYPHSDVHGPVLGISVWDVGQVFRDPCHWTDQAADPGPGVANLVAALVAQPMRNATTPTDVTLAGYRGQYLEWSVPADLKSSTWGGFDACDVEPYSGNHDFASWLGNGLGERYQAAPGQVDRLWVLDVKGQRLVVDATYSPDTPQEDRVELGQLVESLRFVVP